ncbi:MAG: hypothetical protein ACUVXD_05105 [Thermodesulfobacteriota bacterium]
MQARSIVEGSTQEFVEQNRFTIEQSSRQIAPVAYPWGTPVMLAPLYALFGLDMLALKGLNLACYILFLLSLAFLLRDRHPPSFLLFLVSLLAFNPYLILSLDKVLSDIPYLFLSTTSVLLMGRTIVDGRPVISKACDHVCLGLLMALSSVTRGTGLVLVVVLAITHAIRATGRLWALLGASDLPHAPAYRSRRQHWTPRDLLVGALPYAIFLLATAAWNSLLPEGGMSYYLAYYRSISLEDIRFHLGYYLEIFGDFFIGVPHRELLYGATIPFLVAGVWENSRRDYHLLSYAFLNWLIHILWPPVQGLRYVFPLLPVYLHFVLVGLHWGMRALGGASKRAVRVLTLCLGLLVSIQFAGFLFHHALENLSNGRSVVGGPYALHSQKMFAFVRQDIEKDAVVIFFKPRVMKMLTDRRSIMVNRPEDLSRGGYLCLYLGEDAYDQLPDGTVERLLREGRLERLYANPKFQVYRVNEFVRADISGSR